MIKIRINYPNLFNRLSLYTHQIVLVLCQARGFLYIAKDSFSKTNHAKDVVLHDTSQPSLSKWFCANTLWFWCKPYRQWLTSIFSNTKKDWDELKLKWTFELRRAVELLTILAKCSEYIEQLHTSPHIWYLWGTRRSLLIPNVSIHLWLRYLYMRAFI